MANLPLVETWGGTWHLLQYEAPDPQRPSITCRLEFRPNASRVNATKIALVQSATVVENGANIDRNLERIRLDHPTTLPGPPEPLHLYTWRKAQRSDGTRHIDHAPQHSNPVYGAADVPPGAPLSETARGALEATGGPNVSPYRLGRCCAERSATRHLLPHWDSSKKDRMKLTRHSAQQTQSIGAARLYDAPMSTFSGSQDTSYTFETAAVAIAGADERTWYGSVTWGFRYAHGAGVTLSNFALRAQEGTSQEFANLVSIWNSGDFSPAGWDFPPQENLTRMESVKLPPVQTTS
jgi:hypothetical protein